MHRLLVTLSTLLVCAVAAGAQSEASSSARRVTCVPTRDPSANAPEQALAAARKFLRRMTITNQTGRVRLTPQNYRVSEVASLGPATTAGRIAAHYFNVVRRRCGEVQAERTWLVVIDVTVAQLPMKPLAILTSLATSGWRVTFDSGLVAASR